MTREVKRQCSNKFSFHSNVSLPGYIRDDFLELNFKE